MPEPDRRADPAPASDAEREHLVAALRRHLADGRIDLDAFDRRAARVYRATSRDEAGAALADLPLLDASPARRRRRRGHGESAAVAPHWVATDEVFRDPTSGVVMRVWVDPTDGSRHYAPTER